MGVLDFIGKVANAVTPFGAVASGIGSLVSGISGAKAQREANETNLEIARQNNETAIQLARENNQFAKEHAIEMFNLENAYNDPSKQVERLTAAGLNPAAMMETAGGTAVGNSSGTGMVSPSMPSLTTPHVEAVPPMAVGFLDALSSLSQIKLTNAQAKKAGAETTRIEEILPAELDKLFADTKNTEAKTAYQQLMTSLETQFGKTERTQRLRNLCADYSLAVLKGETEEANKLLIQAEKELTDTKNSNEKAQAPIILENLRKTGRAIDASAAASRAAASASSAQAEKTREETRITRAEARIIEANEDDIIFARRLANAHQFQDLGEKSATWLYRFEELKNRRLISEEQLNEAREAVEKAKKENSVYYWNFALSVVERINNGVNKWAPWALSRTDGASSPGEGMMYQSWQSTSTR